MENLIVILIIVTIIVAASSKIIIDKRNGVKCSGCPHAPKGNLKHSQNCKCNSQTVVELKTKL